MKQYLIIILLCFGYLLNSQNWWNINKDLGLSDSLNFTTEIRIYRALDKTNYTSLFRLYQNESDEWTSEFYEHWSNVDGIGNVKTNFQLLDSKSDMEYVYLNLYRSHIMDLPNRKDIFWKLVERGKIEKVERFDRGEKIMKWDVLTKQSMPLHGNSYHFEVRNPSKNNIFNFNNPFYYKRKYPEIDEPNFVCELIEIIRSEFDIWEE